MEKTNGQKKELTMSFVDGKLEIKYKNRGTTAKIHKGSISCNCLTFDEHEALFEIKKLSNNLFK